MKTIILIYFTIAIVVAIVLDLQSKNEDSEFLKLAKEEGLDRWIDINSDGWHFVIFITSIFWLPLLVLGWLQEIDNNFEIDDDSSSES